MCPTFRVPTKLSGALIPCSPSYFTGAGGAFPFIYNADFVGTRRMLPFPHPSPSSAHRVALVPLKSSVGSTQQRANLLSITQGRRQRFASSNRITFQFSKELGLQCYPRGTRVDKEVEVQLLNTLLYFWRCRWGPMLAAWLQQD